MVGVMIIEYHCVGHNLAAEQMAWAHLAADRYMKKLGKSEVGREVTEFVNTLGFKVTAIKVECE
jgi:hypothetical protein